MEIQNQIDLANQSSINKIYQQGRLKLPYVGHIKPDIPNQSATFYNQMKNKESSDSVSNESPNIKMEKQIGQLNNDIARNQQKEDPAQMPAKLKMDPKIRQFHENNNDTGGASFNNTISNVHTVGRNENSMQTVTVGPVNKENKKDQEILDIFNIIMSKNTSNNVENLDIEDLKTFIQKLSKVKKTVQKIYDKQVSSMIRYVKDQQKKSNNRFLNAEKKVETSSDASVSVKAEQLKSSEIFNNGQDNKASYFQNN